MQFEAIPLDTLLAGVEGARKLRLVILDACRDNPFIHQMKRSVATRSIGRGLAAVEPSRGVLVAYAAKEGQLAFDGDGENSPFVAAFAKHVGTPGLEINRLFRRIRSDVLAMTKERQVPFIYGSLPGEDFFFKAPGARIDPPPPPPDQTETTPATPKPPPTAQITANPNSRPAPPPPYKRPDAEARRGGNGNGRSGCTTVGGVSFC